MCLIWIDYLDLTADVWQSQVHKICTVIDNSRKDILQNLLET
jgi:hypothetical protein